MSPFNSCFNYIISIVMIHLFLISQFSTAFHIKLIPLHDSPKLSLFPPNRTSNDGPRVISKNSTARGFLHSRSASMQRSYKGYYVAELFFGTPAQRKLVIVDTGSTLTWVQCSGCNPCFRSDEGSNFEPELSTTYSIVRANDPQCHYRRTRRKNCEFEVSYIGAQASGSIARETLSFRSGEEEIQRMIFGCTLSSRGMQLESPINRIGGVLGLSASENSFLMQASHLTHKRFSYCIPSAMNDFQDKTMLTLGEEIPIGEDVYSTPFRDEFPEDYYITLEGISVNKRMLQIDPHIFLPDQGGFLPDTGSAQTMLAKKAYTVLRRAVAKFFKDEYGITPIKNPEELCYRVGEDVGEDVYARYVPPVIRFHIQGIKFEVDKSAVFSYYNEEGIYCMAITRGEETNLWGVEQMVNHKFVFDAGARMLYIVKQTCPNDEI